jgi:putative restriction endonuclease
VLVTDIYQRRCAVTQERTLPALEAAHIRPYGDGGSHEAQNGLLFRRDIHSLFDAGYVTVTPDLRFEVSSRIKAEFENGGIITPCTGSTSARLRELSSGPIRMR